MKQKLTVKTFLLALIASLLSFMVVLSSAHAKDLARVSVTTDASSVVYKIGDVTAKVIGDLHNHIDKQTLKNISMDNPIAARERELKALSEEKAARSLPEIVEDTLAYYRLVFALSFSALKFQFA